MRQGKVYFTSDAHLGSGYHAQPLEVERRLVRWLESIRPTASAVYFLGDMFDYWFEYRTVVPRGYTRFLGTLSLMSDEGIEIHFFVGNHDVWFADYIATEVGAKIHHHCEVVDILSKRFRLSHGDEECSHEGWVQRLLYRTFRSKICRWLYAGIHPRWTVGFAMSWSLYSRKQGVRRQTLGKIPHAYHNDYFNLEDEYLIKLGKELAMRQPDIDYFLFGHRHLMVDMALRGDKRILILGDWLRYNSFAVWDGSVLYLEQFEVEE